MRSIFVRWFKLSFFEADNDRNVSMHCTVESTTSVGFDLLANPRNAFTLPIHDGMNDSISVNPMCFDPWMAHTHEFGWFSCSPQDTPFIKL